MSGGYKLVWVLTGSLIFVQVSVTIGNSDDHEQAKRKLATNIPMITVASIGVVVVSYLLSTLGMIVWKYIWKKRGDMFTESNKQGSLKSKNIEFTYSQILSITDNLKTKIGEGGFGEVFLGKLKNGVKVAVKLPSGKSGKTLQMLNKFRTEGEFSIRANHKSLVSLIGYCDDGTHVALVYEFMDKGNLRSYLLLDAESSANVLSWRERLQIAIHAAQGLQYLHNGLETPIIHMDIKPSNILLNKRMQAKIADFGLSRDFKNEGDTHGSNFPGGTDGYIDPESEETRKFSMKSDIYSFGIVLLELITRQPVLMKGGPNYIHITTWVWPIFQRGDIQNIVDPKLQGKFNPESGMKAVEMAMSCVRFIEVQGLDMSRVLADLKKCLELEMYPETTPRMVSSGITNSETVSMTYFEIVGITNSFETMIGEGGFGKVYLGTLKNHNQVAVKLPSQETLQHHNEFRTEGRFSIRVHHKNLVSLIGYCDDDTHVALVFEYMAKGNLKKRLSETNANALNWKTRLQIAIDAAQGLEYLHNGCRPPIIHRDIKPSNILLDEKLQAKIADFGLSRDFKNEGDTHVSIVPAGTYGYIDPEAKKTRRFNKKSDIYSFGIVLLELITGQPVLINEGPRDIHITEWVLPIFESRDIQNIVDHKLQREFNIDSIWKAVEVAMSCVRLTQVQKLDMSLVLAYLKECLAIEMDLQTTRRIVSREIEMAPTVSYLSNNDLSGPMPEFLAQELYLRTLEGENPILLRPDSWSSEEKKEFSVIDSIFRLLASEKREANEPKNRKFSHAEIVKMTDNFKKEREIGGGGFGMVYQGCVEGHHVAVKVPYADSQQGLVRAEVRYLNSARTLYYNFDSWAQNLTRVHRINLVSLIGYCNGGNHMALVYEFMENGNLKKQLSETDANVLTGKRDLKLR